MLCFPCIPVTNFIWNLWSGGAKVLCILHHWGVQLILAYGWARPAILVVGKGRGECFYFFCFFTFFPVPLSSLSLSFISSTLSSISFLPFSGRRHKMTLKGWRVVKPQHNQSIIIFAEHLGQRDESIHCKFRSNAPEGAVWSGSALLAIQSLQCRHILR